MKALKLIRLTSIIAALGILAAYTIVYIFQGEYQLFNWIILLSCLVLVPLLLITEFQKEKHPNLLVKHNKKRRNLMLSLCAIMLVIGVYDMIAFDKAWKGLPFILIVIYLASTSLIRYKIRQQYLEENPS
ncbi:MAG: hypothetical protein J6S01_07880 [Bacteroidales bacterium]|nr:hypothetical protein [Bacteroidales bacterium]